MLIHTIAAVILKIAYLIVGCLLCFMGQRLLEKGIEGRTKIEGDVAGKKWTLLTSSPGVVYAAFGLCIIVYAIITPTVYEETSSVVQQESKPANTPSSAQQNSQTETTTATKSSRLAEQPMDESALLRSRIALYSIHHKNMGIADQNVTNLIGQMPAKDNSEPWSITYQRFGEILRKNPSALLQMLDQAKFSWLLDKDKKDKSLSDLVSAELGRLQNTDKAKE